MQLDKCPCWVREIVTEYLGCVYHISDIVAEALSVNQAGKLKLQSVIDVDFSGLGLQNRAMFKARSSSIPRYLRVLVIHDSNRYGMY